MNRRPLTLALLMAGIAFAVARTASGASDETLASSDLGAHWCLGPAAQQRSTVIELASGKWAAAQEPSDDNAQHTSCDVGLRSSASAAATSCPDHSFYVDGDRLAIRPKSGQYNVSLTHEGGTTPYAQFIAAEGGPGNVSAGKTLWLKNTAAVNVTSGGKTYSYDVYLYLQYDPVTDMSGAIVGNFKHYRIEFFDRSVDSCMAEEQQVSACAGDHMDRLLSTQSTNQEPVGDGRQHRQAAGACSY